MKLFKIKKHLPTLLVFLFLSSLVLLFFAQPVLAQDEGGKWGEKLWEGEGVFVEAPGGAAGIIVNIVMWMMSIIALLALAFIVYGAIKYVTSAGNEKQIEEAKKILLYAIIGLVIAILAVVIIQLVARVVERGERPPEKICCICRSGRGDVLGCPEKLENKTCQDTCDYYRYSWATVQEISCTQCP